jgi:hypothetical protein
MSNVKKAGTAKAQAKAEDVLLAQQMAQNKLEFPRTPLYLVSVCTAFLPAYLSHAVFGLPWTSVANLPLYLIVIASTAYMLVQAYVTMVETEYWRRTKHWSEVKEADEGLLRKLRLQTAIGYTFFLTNGLFFVLCTVLQAYVLRNHDSRASLIISPLLTAAGLWFLSQKNEETRKRRMKDHK